MDEDEEMPATLEDPAADEEETRALVEAFEAEFRIKSRTFGQSNRPHSGVHDDVAGVQWHLVDLPERRAGARRQGHVRCDWRWPRGQGRLD